MWQLNSTGTTTRDCRPALASLLRQCAVQSITAGGVHRMGRGLWNCQAARGGAGLAAANRHRKTRSLRYGIDGMGGFHTPRYGTIIINDPGLALTPKASPPQRTWRPLARGRQAALDRSVRSKLWAARKTDTPPKRKLVTLDARHHDHPGSGFAVGTHPESP